MQKLTCEEILEATGGTLLNGKRDTVFSGISTDSRKINYGDLYIPLKGEKFDGHDFIESSFSSGAAGVLTHKATQPSDDRVVIKVQDTLRALQDIARFYRKKFDVRVVGITGSVGKTSTKDMVACVLGEQYNVLKTQGNFNNEIGLPLTVFNLGSTHQAAVLEMGMSGFGEISRLTSIVMPDIAIITNIGLSHIEKLGSRENILKAKLEILEGLNRNGLVILNADDGFLRGVKGQLPFRMVFYGIDQDAEYRACRIEEKGEEGTTFEIVLDGRNYEVHIPVPGTHNVYNALAAIAAGIELGIPADKAIKGIGQFSPGKMRLNIINHNGIKVINDAYNASPQSMEAAINVLKDIGEGGRKIAVLGDMLEMGEWAYNAHVNVGKYLVSKNIDYIITVGTNGKNIALGAFEAGAEKRRVYSFDSNEQLNEFISSFVKPGDTVLIKGSRGMKMEQIVEKLTIEG